jgi:hypothetical protein
MTFELASLPDITFINLNYGLTQDSEINAT